MNKNTYLIKCLMTLTLVSLFGWSHAQYCASSANFAGDSEIDRVLLAGNTTTIDQSSISVCATYTDYTGVTPAELTAGNTYTISIYHGTCGFTQYQKQSTAWIDFDGNGTFDASEQLGAITISNFGVAGTINTMTFTVPSGVCGGNTRMRVVVEESGAPAPCGNYNWGETEDYTVTLVNPVTGLNADFVAPGTIYTGALATFANVNQTGYLSHNWTVDGTPYSSTNAQHTFNTAGTYDVKLLSTNCLGTDSVTKTITVVDPTVAPVADFVAASNVVEIFEFIKLTDLSTNGANFWNWKLINGTDTIDGDDQIALRGNDPFTNRNPEIFTGNFPGAVGVGIWEVCLVSTNSIPLSSAEVCKVGYITVQQSIYNIGPGTSIPANIITATSGTIYDNGGPTGNYTSPQSNLEALIAPCGAQSVTLDFTTFDFNSNANLKVYDGVNALGTPLHPANGFDENNMPSGPITAPSGAIYLLFNSTSGGNAPGFAADWTSVAGTGATPVADFTAPGTTLYNAVAENFINTSQNAEGNTTFEWTLTGPSTLGFPKATRDIENEAFNTNGNYSLTLTVTGCDGSTSSKTRNFTVVAPSSPTNLDFSADNQRPSLGEDVTLTATSDKANRWEWNIFSPIGVSPAVPYIATSKEAVFQFNQPGTYTVQCRGYNTVDELASEATVVKTDYIIVVENCTPVIGVVTSTDVGISYVSLEDPISGDKFENTSVAGLAPGYTDYSDLGTVELNFGGNYNFEVKRTTNNNTMTRKIWIDWNVDGVFDANELVAEETTPTQDISFTGIINVPDASSAFEANTVMRVGCSYQNDLNMPCGANSDPNANRVGEFEDYSIRVINDGDKPVITLNGNDTIFIEQVNLPDLPTYTSPGLGATALDPSQGNVTANVTHTSDLDQYLPGIYYEVYNASDASGNTAAEVTRVIYVVSDQTAPVITINGLADTTIDVGSVWTDLGATALDNKEGDLTSAIVTTSNVDANLLGVYQVTYSVQDFQGNPASETRIVRVVDTELPVIENARADKITSAPEWDVEVQLQSVFADVTSATDNYNDLSNLLTLSANPASPQGGAAVDTRFPGTTSVTYTAVDESGNTATQVINYVIRDFIPPVIDLRTLDVVNHRVNTPYTSVPPTATDNLYSSSEISLTKTGIVDAFTLGSYVETYTATDAAGNTTTKTRTVNVIDDLSPVITGKDGGVIKLGVGSKANMIDYINFSDNYDAPAIMRANATTTFNNVNLQEAGLYSVVWTTEDASGNEAAEYRLVVDVDYDHSVVTNGVNDINLDDLLSIAPNPTNGKLNINVNLPENEEINLGVFNTMGQQVVLIQNAKVNNGQYITDLSHLTNGIYYVKMNLQGNIITKKVVLNK